MIRRKLTLLILLGLIGALIVFPSNLTLAQDGGAVPTPIADGPANPESGITTVHVVQRGENLFAIAQQYGTTVDSIAAANGITDARFIEAGQRLLIPNAQKESIGIASTHLVQPGETLITLALKYKTTPDSLARLNNITNGRNLYAGETIQVRHGDDGSDLDDNIGLYVAREDDNPLRIAARFGIPLGILRNENGWNGLRPIWDGQPIRLPGAATDTFVDLPRPLTALALGPLPAIQGQSLVLLFETTRQVDATAQFMGRAVSVARVDDTHYGTMLGIHAMADPGVYSLTLMLTDTDGGILDYRINLEIFAGDYGFETIPISADQQGLLEAGVVESELLKTSTIMSQFTRPAYVQGLMALPSTGTITSQFGTRRSYNGSEIITFHGGADFGGAPGSIITAPAPGTVVLAERLGVRGNAVIIDHGWGVYSGYWHQSELYVSEGQFLKKGDEIGLLGSTGLSTGAHLHWEMWVGGVQVNPLQWTQHAFLPEQP